MQLVVRQDNPQQLTTRSRSPPNNNNNNNNNNNRRRHHNNQQLALSPPIRTPSYQYDSVIEPLELSAGTTTAGADRHNYDNWEVVMGTPHSSHVVLYQPQQRKLAVYARTAGEDDEEDGGGYVRCPLCGQPTTTTTATTTTSPTATADQPTTPLTRLHRMQQRYFNITAAHYQHHHGAANNEAATDDDDDDEQLRQQQHEEEVPDSGGLQMNTGYYRRFFVEEKLLGRGSYGSVYLARHEMDGVPIGWYAVKKVPVGASHVWLRRVLREVKALEALHHVNIVAYRHSWLEQYKPSDFGPSVPCIFILMEYANCGSVGDLVWARRPRECRTLRWRDERVYLAEVRPTTPAANDNDDETPRATHFLTERMVWKLFVDMASGLQHLHMAGILHRDVKLENMLLTSMTYERTHKLDGFWRTGELPADTRVLLSDMGECVLKGVPMRRSGNTGTLVYCAPETLVMSSGGGGGGGVGDDDDDDDDCVDFDAPAYSFTEAADVWSLGVVLYIMAFGVLPYAGETPADMLRNIVDAPPLHMPSIPSERSDTLKQLIHDMLTIDPLGRPSIARVLKIAIEHESPLVANTTTSASLPSHGTSATTSATVANATTRHRRGIVVSKAAAASIASTSTTTTAATPLALNWYTTPFARLADLAEERRWMNDWLVRWRRRALVVYYAYFPIVAHASAMMMKVWLTLEMAPPSTMSLRVLVTTALCLTSLFIAGARRHPVSRYVMAVPAVASFIWITLDGIPWFHLLLLNLLATCLQLVRWYGAPFL